MRDIAKPGVTAVAIAAMAVSLNSALLRIDTPSNATSNHVITAKKVSKAKKDSSSKSKKKLNEMGAGCL